MVLQAQPRNVPGYLYASLREFEQPGEERQPCGMGVGWRDGNPRTGQRRNNCPHLPFPSIQVAALDTAVSRAPAKGQSACQELNCQVLEGSIFGRLHLIVDDFHAIFVSFLSLLPPSFNPHLTTLITPHHVDHERTLTAGICLKGRFPELRAILYIRHISSYLVASVPHVFSSSHTK